MSWSGVHDTNKRVGGQLLMSQFLKHKKADWNFGRGDGLRNILAQAGALRAWVACDTDAKP